MSLIFVLFITAVSGVFLGCILDVPGSGLRTLETGVGTLVSVSVTVVDARTIPWSGRTCRKANLATKPTSRDVGLVAR